MGCIDSCTADIPDTEPPELYDFNCGCREGYYCESVYSICQPGCSNDRECCEIWNDDGDYRREEGEVTLVTGCTNTCDNDPSDDGAASYQCVNHGTSGAEFCDPCEHDSQCPADGRCLLPTYLGPDGTPYWPGGYCIKERCDAVGRSCSDGGGHCANLGTEASPAWQCTKACTVGQDPDAVDFPCRQTPADEKMTCMPSFHDPAFLDTADYDGFCYYGNFNSITAHNYFTDCRDDDECYSPLGLGFCALFQTAGFTENLCSILCTEDLAVNQDICGSSAEGVCFDHPNPDEASFCLPACDTPGGSLGANGCPVTDPLQWACYPTADWTGQVFVSSDATMPAGFCYMACEDDTWCLEIFGVALTCDTTSGVCHS
jgi:hypothetical protein